VENRGRKAVDGGYQHAAFAFEAAGVFEQARSCNLVRGRERDRPAARSRERHPWTQKQPERNECRIRGYQETKSPGRVSGLGARFPRSIWAQAAALKRFVNHTGPTLFVWLPEGQRL